LIRISRAFLPFLLLGTLLLTPNIQPAKSEGTIKAVVLDSWGADHSRFTIYPQLNNEWPQYGPVPITIDYSTLKGNNITYYDIALTGADVLIISHAYPGSEHIFTDNEIAAIKQYVEEGHGIIGTYGSLVPENNHKLAELFGMDQNMDYIFYPSGEISTGVFNILDLNHPVFANLPNPFRVPRVSETMYVPSHNWTVEGVTDGTIIALTTDNEAAIVTGANYRSIYFTNQMEEAPAIPDASKRIFYNAIVWAGMPSMTPFQVKVRISPETLNLKSKGKWITVHIELPYNLSAARINPATLLLNDTVPSERHPRSLNKEDLMLKFNRAEVTILILDSVNVSLVTKEMFSSITLTITGKLNDGTPFQGNHIVKISHMPKNVGMGRFLMAK